MKHVLRILAIILILALLSCFVGCVEADSNGGTMSVNVSSVVSDGAESNASSESTAVDPATCSHQYEEQITRQPRALDCGERTFTCSLCKTAYTEEIPTTDTVRILAVGNSLTNNATQYLWEIITDAGVPKENVVIGRLFISGCTVSRHWQNILNFAEDYDYTKSTGTWISHGKYSIQMALEDEDWDYIVLQETIASVRRESSYKNLGNLINYIKGTNPDAQLAWQLMWAYQAETEAKFCKYISKAEQLNMYNDIISTYNSQVKHWNEIEHLIPSGTAVQNLRTSYIGDTVTSGGLHMTAGHGQYLTALTWYTVLTGGDVDIVDWYPSNHPELVEDFAVIRQSVKDAVQKPLEITQQAK